MAASARFGFQRGGALDLSRRPGADVDRVPAASMVAALRDRRVIFFLAAWFGLNILFGLGAIAIPGVEGEIAWQAHSGGFIAGFALFALFDPVATAPARLDGSRGEEEAPTLH